VNVVYATYQLLEEPAGLSLLQPFASYYKVEEFSSLGVLHDEE